MSVNPDGYSRILFYNPSMDHTPSKAYFLSTSIKEARKVHLACDFISCKDLSDKLGHNKANAILRSFRVNWMTANGKIYFE